MKTLRLYWLTLGFFPVAYGAAQPELVAARTVVDVAYLAPDRAEKLDLYLPATPAPGAPPAPAVVWIHGGGWTGGTKNEARAKEICTTLTAAGYVAVSIDYRLGEGAWPTNIYDCKNAVRFLRAHAAEYHLDPNRIAVAGGSAGGHLALMVGLTADDPAFEPTVAATPYPGVSSAVRAIVDLYGITNLLTRQKPDAKGKLTGELVDGGATKVYGATREANPALWRTVSPVTHIGKKSPPVLILHGRADATVDYEQSVELAAVLKKNGVPHELHLIDGIGHTFDLQTWSKKPLPQDLRPVFLKFLERHLRPLTVK
jgi:acetyl esterase/lipase